MCIPEPVQGDHPLVSGVTWLPPRWAPLPYRATTAHALGRRSYPRGLFRQDLGRVAPLPDTTVATNCILTPHRLLQLRGHNPAARLLAMRRPLGCPPRCAVPSVRSADAPPVQAAARLRACSEALGKLRTRLLDC